MANGRDIAAILAGIGGGVAGGVQQQQQSRQQLLDALTRMTIGQRLQQEDPLRKFQLQQAQERAPLELELLRKKVDTTGRGPAAPRITPGQALSDLNRQLVETFKEIDTAVVGGRITQERADALKTDLRSRALLQQQQIRAGNIPEQPLPFLSISQREVPGRLFGTREETVGELKGTADILGGLAPPTEPATEQDILSQVNAGTITADEGRKRINALRKGK
jgi:hypothetical protein